MILMLISTLPRKSQYIGRLAKWRFKKYSNKAEWEYAEAQLRKRKDEGGKDTEIIMNGKLISTKKLKKELARYVGPWNSGLKSQSESP